MLRPVLFWVFITMLLMLLSVHRKKAEKENKEPCSSAMQHFRNGDCWDGYLLDCSPQVLYLFCNYKKQVGLLFPALLHIYI